MMHRMSVAPPMIAKKMKSPVFADSALTGGLGDCSVVGTIDGCCDDGWVVLGGIVTTLPLCVGNDGKDGMVGGSVVGIVVGTVGLTGCSCQM